MGVSSAGGSNEGRWDISDGGLDVWGLRRWLRNLVSRQHGIVRYQQALAVASRGALIWELSSLSRESVRPGIYRLAGTEATENQRAYANYLSPALVLW